MTDTSRAARRRRASRRAALGVSALVSALGCGGRDADLEAPLLPEPGVGLNRAVALGDEPLQRVVVLSSNASHELSVTSLDVGKNQVLKRPDVSGERLLVLASGVQPRRLDTDELPSLTVIDTREAPVVQARYELGEAFSDISLDPEGRWAVLSGAAQNFVENPNQLVLVDLNDPDFEPVTKTIRSFGAAPERFQFTPPLDLPGGEQRFLIVETEQDVTLVSLDDLTRPEITIGLPRTPSGATGQPLQVAVHPGAPDVAGDALLAIRLENDPNLLLVNFPATEEAEAGAFSLTLNLVPVGGQPSEMAFVETDRGVRLAALVPARREAALVHPATTQVDLAPLPAAFDRMQRIEPSSSGSSAGDVALLWSPSTSMVAFWSLGRTVDQSFRAVDTLDLAARVRQVFDVPGDTLSHRKLLQAEDFRFFVLDLELRQSFPMLSSAELSLRVAPDGLRAWAFAPGSPRLAKVDLSTLEPTSLEIERPVSQLFDIAAGPGGERSLIALHAAGARGATVLNAREPDTASSRFFAGLLIGGE